MQLVSLVIVGRGGHMDALSEYREEEAIATPQGPAFSLPQVSSTAIREALTRGELEAPILKSWVAREVLALVREHGLYQRHEGDVSDG